jgi:hypothetical protein
VCLLKFNTFPSVKNFLRISIALPAERLRFAARFFCQGSPLRSDERKLRGLDSADGEAPGTARKSICFLCSKVPLPKKQKTKKGKGANNADRNN